MYAPSPYTALRSTGYVRLNLAMTSPEFPNRRLFHHQLSLYLSRSRQTVFYQYNGILRCGLLFSSYSDTHAATYSN